MPVGIMHQMWATASCSDTEVLEQAATDVHLAEDLGFDSVMFGEHHFLKDAAFYGRVPTPELVIASLAATTSSIKLGTGVKVLALDAGWRTAEAMLLLDLLSEGRAFFCLGQGTTADVFPPGTTDDERRALFRERLAEVLSALRAAATDQGGTRLNPVPVRDVTRRFWVAARDEASISMAATEGLNFVVGQAEIAIVQRRLVERYRTAGGSGEARGVRVVCAADTDEAALQAVAPAAETYFAQMSKGPYFREAIASGLIPDRAPNSLAEATDWLSFCVGTPEHVAEKLFEYQAITGVDRLDVMFHLPDLDPADVQRSMRLFASEVMPILDAAIGAPAS